MISLSRAYRAEALATKVEHSISAVHPKAAQALAIGRLPALMARRTAVMTIIDIPTQNKHTKPTFLEMPLMLETRRRELGPNGDG